MSTAKKVLPLWIVYKNPLDYPGKYVLRRQWALNSGEVEIDAACFISNSLEAVREQIPFGFVRMARFPEDDPAILESWI